MTYPTMLYAKDGRHVIVNSQEAHDELPGEWFDSPAAFGLVTCPSVEQQYQGRSHTTHAYAPHGVQMDVRKIRKEPLKSEETT